MRPNSNQYSTSTNLDARIALHRKYTPLGHDMLDTIWAQYDFARGQRVVEVGCGSGAFWTHDAAKQCDINLLLTDASKGMLEAARSNLTATCWKPRFELASVENLPFAESEFDVLLSHFMLYHVDDKDAALREFDRVTDDWVGIVLIGESSMRRVFDAMTETDASVSVPISEGERFNSVVALEPIERVFAHVDIHPYEYTMQVTRADDVVAYVQSVDRTAQQKKGFWTRYRQRLEEEINTSGFFGVDKSCTLFICRN